MPPPSLVFICAKSEDYEWARKVYAFLTERNIECFFSDESLYNSAYKQAIDDALERAAHLVVVTSSGKHCQSPWVRHEWDTFDNELLSTRKNGNLLTVRCGACQEADLPSALRQRQSLHIDNLSRLPRYVDRPPPKLGDDRSQPATLLLDEVFCRLLPARWIGALKQRFAAWLSGWVALDVIACALVTGVGLAILKVPPGNSWFLLAGGMAVLLVPTFVFLVAGQQWLVQLRLRELRLWWVFYILTRYPGDGLHRLLFSWIKEGGSPWLPFVEWLAFFVSLGAAYVLVALPLWLYLRRHVTGAAGWFRYFTGAKLVEITLLHISGIWEMRSTLTPNEYVVSLLARGLGSAILGYGMYRLCESPRLATSAKS